MGYYCTVPQCTSLAGKTKNVKFHRFPRDDALANRWNDILHRHKPFTKYSKVCSLHFTQADYNVTTMGKKTGQWKTLSKDAIPSQNLPKLNPDGTVMVIRKSRTLKYKPDAAAKKEDDASSEKRGDWTNTSGSSYSSSPGSSANTSLNISDTIQNRLSALNTMANAVSPQLRSILQQPPKPIKHDAVMQTDPLDISKDDEEQAEAQDAQTCGKDECQFTEVYSHTKPSKGYSKEAEHKDYSDYNTKSPYKSPSYTPEPVESYNKEYNGPEYKIPDAYKHQEYEKPELEAYDKSSNESYESRENAYEREGYAEYQKQEYFQQNAADVLRSQQHNLQMLQQQLSGGRMTEDRLGEEERFYGGRIKEEIDLSAEEAMAYDATHKDEGYATQQLLQQQQKLMDFYERRPPIKSEPDLNGVCDTVMQPEQSPLPSYYRTEQHSDPRSNSATYYSQHCEEVLSQQQQQALAQQQFRQQPGAELLIAKQNALAAQANLWQNSMKRPFYYSETPHTQFNSQLHSRYESGQTVERTSFDEVFPQCYSLGSFKRSVKVHLTGRRLKAPVT